MGRLLLSRLLEPRVAVLTAPWSVKSPVELTRVASVLTASGIRGCRGQDIWPNEGLAHYGAAKAAMHTFSQALALEWEPYNVRVNVLIPGITETPP
ncbi:MAG: SDR family oxidoreductase [Chloroflexi bacterium]|nr:SDR family oxidoreductase [Chloroflexota bacterium]